MTTKLRLTKNQIGTLFALYTFGKLSPRPSRNGRIAQGNTIESLRAKGLIEASGITTYRVTPAGVEALKAAAKKAEEDR